MKTLIYWNEDSLKPVGGPAGYLYNLKVERDERKDSDLVFITGASSPLRKIKQYIKNNCKCQKIMDIYYSMIYKENTLVYTNMINAIIKDSEKIGSLDLNKFEMIHFHNTFDLYREKKRLDTYSGIVILTSHSPKVNYKEIIEDYAKEEYRNNPALFEQAEVFDEYAFERADYIVFPCEGAEEPYFHTWPKYNIIRKEDKIRYLPTGVLPVTCKKSRLKIRKQYSIPKDALLLSFVGRHNEVKGYDILKEIFKKMSDVYVICCGKSGDIQPPSSTRWIEVGWTDDPYSIVAASDVYLLPNRETYFDIAMLQTMSIGKCSVISNTGGNKEFCDTPGVTLFDGVETAIKAIRDYARMSESARMEIESLQRKEFQEKYSIEVFYDNYKKLLGQLVSNGNYKKNEK